MTELPQSDLYQVIELATKRLAADQDRLSQAEVDAIAQELGIDRKYVEAAQHELAQLRADEIQAKAKRARQRKIRVSLLVSGTVLLCVMATSARNRLADEHAEVSKARAQLVNVIERQHSVQNRLASAPFSEGKDAELAGAENRMRIQRKRYDEHATRYNRSANGYNCEN